MQGLYRAGEMPPYVSPHLPASHLVFAVQADAEGRRSRCRRSATYAVQMTVVWTLRPNN